MNAPRPEVGEWYETPQGGLLEVVAFDPDEDTIEVQYYDGAIAEYDTDSWDELELAPAAPPEDAGGSLEVTPEELGLDPDLPAQGLDDDFIDRIE